VRIGSQRDRSGHERAAWLGSAAVHGAAIVLLVWSHFIEPTRYDFETVAVNLVAAPTVTEAPPAREDDLVVETPDPQPPEPEPEEEVIPDPEETPPPETEPEPEPEPEEPEEQPDSTPEEPDEEEAQPEPTESDLEVAEEASAAEVTRRMEGLRRDFPEYYGNIVAQIDRCLRWRGETRWEAKILFAISRDGSVTPVDFVERSGSFGFDLAVVAAVDDCAAGRFGPLPDDMETDELPVLFTIRPPGGDGDTDAASPAAAHPMTR